MLLIIPVEVLRRQLGIGDHIEIAMIKQSVRDHAEDTFIAELRGAVLPELSPGTGVHTVFVADRGRGLMEAFQEVLVAYKLLPVPNDDQKKNLRRIELTP